MSGQRLPKEKENCLKCGEKLELFIDMVFTSNPPKFKTVCNSCKDTGYIFCHEIVTIKTEERRCT